ncbi:histone acetyltransferase subunit NuA4-domain-containing protein [Pestalotiopsis sp. NC0098]|nr:histone acetyltransferase subunit NuA4-domain-containing protein [Pestalotiopsis sp. NC0098]
MTDAAASAKPGGSNGAGNNGNTNGGAGGSGNDVFDRKKEMAEYEAEKKIIKDAIARRAKIMQELGTLETKIADLEGRYLESTPGGNILTGFDNYTKGLTGAAAQRRKVGNAEQNRVFSRSSVSYNALNQEAATPASGTSTPGAPTPISTTFNNKDKGPSEAPTPTSATAEKKTASKKKKDKAPVPDDSETDSKADNKKVRTQFGANGRK